MFTTGMVKLAKRKQDRWFKVQTEDSFNVFQMLKKTEHFAASAENKERKNLKGITHKEDSF